MVQRVKQNLKPETFPVRTRVGQRRRGAQQGRSVGLGSVAVNISSEDRDRLRGAPSYRRAVWGLRMVAVGPALFLSGVLALALRVPNLAVFVITGVAFSIAGIGVLLGWSAVLPLLKHQRQVLAPYKMNSSERASTIRAMVLRDVINSRQAGNGSFRS